MKLLGGLEGTVWAGKLVVSEVKIILKEVSRANGEEKYSSLYYRA